MVKPKREVTIRDLLTHTSGLTYSWAGEGPVNQMYRKYNIRPYYFGALDAELNKFPGNTCQFSNAAASVPLLHNPGEKWSYGINMDILGCIVEVISKMTGIFQIWRTRFLYFLQCFQGICYIPGCVFA